MDGHLDDLTLSGYLDGEVDDAPAVAAHLATCADCRTRMDALAGAEGALAALADPAGSNERVARIAAAARLEGLVAGLKDPVPCPERRARILARLRPRRVGRLLWRAAAAVLLTGVVGFAAALAGRSPGHVAGPVVAAQVGDAAVPAPPLPFAGVQPLDQALARYDRLLPGLRERWLGRLSLDGAGRRALLEAAVAGDPAARAFALSWWGARRSVAPVKGLVAKSAESPGAVALAALLAERLSRDAGDRLLIAVCLESPAPEPAVTALVRRRGAGAGPTLLVLLYREETHERARGWLDQIGPEAVAWAARMLPRVKHRAPLLAYLGGSRHASATQVLLARARRGPGSPALFDALRHRDDPAVPGALQRWVAHPTGGAAAIRALARRGPEGLKRLRALISRAESGLANRVMMALADVPGEGATGALALGLERSRLAPQAIELLARRGTPLALAALEKAAGSEHRERVYAALCEVATTTVLAMLARECADPGRARALLPRLIALDDARALPALAAALQHRRLSARALSGIGVIKDDRAIGYLIEALRSPALRRRAHQLLVQRTGQRIGASRRQWKDWYETVGGMRS